MGVVTALGWTGVLKFMEGGWHVLQHGHADIFSVGFVFPVYSDPKEFGYGAVNGDDVQLFEGVVEVIKIVGVGVCYTEIIDD